MALGLGIGAEYNYEAIRWDPSVLPQTGSLALWLNFEDGQTIETGNVAEWKDKSGNNNHATQSVAIDRAAASSGALDFESGEGDHYDFASQIDIEEENGFILSIVCEIESVGSNMTILGLNNTQHFLEFQSGGDNVRIRLGGTTTSISPSNANEFHSSEGKFLLTLVREAGATGNLILYKNGTVLAQGTQAKNPGDGEFASLGVRNADRFFDGKIHEVLLYLNGTDDWSDIELGLMFDYLTTKHNL